MFKKINHIGMAVKDIDAAIVLWTKIYGVTVEKPFVAGDMKVATARVGDVLIELMAPAEAGGVIAKFLEKRGEGIHHICYEVKDVREAIKALSAQGLELIDKEPRQGMEGEIAFIHPRSTHGVLTEIVQVPAGSQAHG
jgi:methylmalonyl-CoA/ethylmalonyl-CoA epimerase